MSEVDLIADTLRRDIAAAFAGTALASDDVIAPHDCHECAGVRDAFRGQRWQDIPRSVIDDNAIQPVLMTPSAGRYFMPAYLLRGIDELARSDYGEVAMHLMFRLADPINDEVALFTDAQRGVVPRFVELVATIEGDCEEVATARVRWGVK